MIIKEELETIIKKVNSYNQLLTHLRLNKSGGNYMKLRKLIEKWNIDKSHFLTRKEIAQNASKSRNKKLEEILIQNSTYNTGNSIKKRLYKEGLKQPICELCGQNEIWNGMKISLILDHINGDHYDNRIENLRIVCPNCNAGLDTFTGKNKNKK